MPAEEFFRGTTLGNREVVLFYEPTDEGNQHITGTLDGESLEIETVNWGWPGPTATVKTAGHGTFSATTTDYPEDHSAALRRYLEFRPAGGYEVTFIEQGVGTAGIGPNPDAPATTCTVEISNGRLSERAEFRYSEAASRVLARGQNFPTDEQLLQQVRAEVRTDSWEKIRHRAENPSFTFGLAHPL